MPVKDSATSVQDVQVLSNALEDMTTPGFGPEQADIEVISSEYVSFDYNGQQKDDPVLSVRWNCRPVDGSNDGKDFTIEWTTGGKIADFSIVNNGHAIVPVGSKTSLHNTSNWALLLKSLHDAGFSSVSLNGPDGIGYFATGRFTLRQIPQPERSGLDSKTAKGYDKKYYTCLKIISLPGEKARPGARAATKAAPQAKPAASAPAAASNGAGSSDVLDFITTALSSGPLAIKDLGKAVFTAAKAAGKPVAESQSLGKQAMDESFLTEHSTDEEFNERWSVANGIVTLAQA